jgi:hypothetical protein
MDRNLSVHDLAVFRDKAAAAKVLAKRHYEIEPGLTRIIRCSGSAEVEMRPTEPLKFLEVNRDTVAAGIMPLGFGPAPASGIPFPSIIVEVTPEEFENIKNRDLLLPAGWETEEELPKSPGAAGAA